MRRNGECQFLLVSQSPYSKPTKNDCKQIATIETNTSTDLSEPAIKQGILKARPKITSRKSDPKLDETRRLHLTGKHIHASKSTENKKILTNPCRRPHSWYGYGTIQEEEVNLYSSPDPGGTVAENASLLDGGRVRRVGVCSPPQPVITPSGGVVTTPPISSQQPPPNAAPRRRRRFDLRLMPSLKSLMGRRASRGNLSSNSGDDAIVHTKMLDKTTPDEQKSYNSDNNMDAKDFSSTGVLKSSSASFLSNSVLSDPNSSVLRSSNSNNVIKTNLIHSSSSHFLNSSVLKKNKSSNNLKTSESNSSVNLFKSSSSSVNLSNLNHRLWQMVPLLKRDDSCTSLAAAKIAKSNDGLRKCETVLALTGVHGVRPLSLNEPLKPVNRLRHESESQKHIRVSSASSEGFKIGDQSERVKFGDVESSKPMEMVCSRCSSLLSLASGSQYSLVGGGFAPISVPSKRIAYCVCKLCLMDVARQNTTEIEQCGCSFCTECMRAYVNFEVMSGAYAISCPDAECPVKGALGQAELKNLGGSQLLHKHNQYRLNREIDLDSNRTWCPKAGCETVCQVRPDDTGGGGDLSIITKSVGSPDRSGLNMAPCNVHCPTCSEDFCSACKKSWHPGVTCDQHSFNVGGRFPLLFENEIIKSCPLCSVPIEKDEGCAQMMCKRCKHVFCWYCLASLDDDFLLRHYDKGPCKNKLGHSRASVIWHRTQVIGIFAGFGILLLVASPLLLLAAPCIVCCKCRVCSGATHIEPDEEIDDS